jgi:hypothetical protein
MVESRWLRWFGPGAVALGAMGLIASTAIAAGVRPWTPNACGGPPTDRIEAARARTGTQLTDLRGAPWFRLDPMLDGAGALAGQRLALGLEGQRTARALDLPREAFAAGPFGRIVLVGSDDGSASRVQAIDVANGCAWSLSDEPDVIRRATVDPSGTFLYEMRVDRANRADRGVWRRPLDGSEAARQVLGPPPADESFGRTFSTEFLWDVAGDRLAVESCGEIACRIRVMGPGGAPIATLEDPDLGSLVGLDGEIAVTYEACRGLPCPIVATDLRTGTRRVLADTAALAVVIPTSDGTRLIHELGSGSERRLRSVAPGGEGGSDLGLVPADLRLHPSAARAGAATSLPPGWVLLAPDGRLPADATTAHQQLRHVPDDATVPLDEALR